MLSNTSYYSFPSKIFSFPLHLSSFINTTTYSFLEGRVLPLTLQAKVLYLGTGGGFTFLKSATTASFWALSRTSNLSVFRSESSLSIFVFNSSGNLDLACCARVCVNMAQAIIATAPAVKTILYMASLT